MVLAIGGPSVRPPPHFTGFTLKRGAPPTKIFLEFSIAQAKHSNSSNGGAPQNIVAVTLCPSKIYCHGPPMVLGPPILNPWRTPCDYFVNTLDSMIRI